MQRMTIQDQLVSQLDEVLAEFAALLKRSQYDDISDLPEAEVTKFVSRAEAAIQRVAGRPSPYADQSDRVFKQGGYTGLMARSLAGILQSLRSDVAAGYLRSQRELLHAELFADFLEMSQHLLNEGYKDAAAVIAGSSLEAHLRQLCVKSGIACDVSAGGGTTPKKADRLNADLAAANVYSKLDQKNVTAWLDLRNKAAHGRYAEYEPPQVGILISGIRDFITRNPA
jgi:hypothetical protein